MLAGKVYSGRLVRPALFGGSPEWTAGVRRHPTAVVAAAVVLLVCACIPYAGFPALYLAAAACGAFYAANEPLQLLLLPGKGAARLLARKIFTAWRNYFLMTAPFAVLALLAQPRSAWMAAAWAPLAALALLYFVAAKYARYDPAVAAGCPAGRRGISPPAPAAPQPLPRGELPAPGRTQPQPLPL